MYKNTMKQKDFDKEYLERFDWRRDQHISNIAELSRIAHSGGPEILNELPGLISSRDSKDPSDALRWSILILWLQAAESFIFGQFEPCILTCGAVVERCLKLEYRVSKGALPSGTWTLGKCIYDLDWANTRIASGILDHAKKCKGHRDSRAHALLEHTDPQASLSGGERGVQQLSSSRYLIEPYRGEAAKIMTNTWQILSELYSAKISERNRGET
jgi:hypothetical protein